VVYCSICVFFWYTGLFSSVCILQLQCFVKQTLTITDNDGMFLFHIQLKTLSKTQNSTLTSSFIWVDKDFIPQEEGCGGSDRMVVGFTTTCGIGAYHHWCCGFDSLSGRGVQHYVIKFVSGLWQVGGFLRALNTIKPNHTTNFE
jgi:hypothetical protein